MHGVLGWGLGLLGWGIKLNVTFGKILLQRTILYYDIYSELFYGMKRPWVKSPRPQPTTYLMHLTRYSGIVYRMIFALCLCACMMMTRTGWLRLDEAEALTLMCRPWIIFSSNWQDSAGLWLLASTIERLVVNQNLEMIRTQTDLLKI